MMSDAEEDKTEAYYLRLHWLITKHGRSILKSTFDMKVPQLRNALLKHRQTLNNLRKDKKKKFFARYFNKLYPWRGNIPNTSDDFDITMLVALLRNIAGLNPQSQWWDETDNNMIPINITDDEADIVRIRNLRNVVSHDIIAKLDIADLQARWNLAEKVLLRLAAKCNIFDFKTTIDECLTSNLNLISEEFRSLRDNTKYFLSEHSDNDTFVETNVFKEAKRILDKHNIVFLSGHRGEGKTSMAARLALTVCDARQCLLLQEPSDWKHVDLSSGLIQTIIIDNLYGQVTLDHNSVASWANVLNCIELVTKTKDIHAVITGVTYVLKQSDEEIGAYSIDRNTTCHVTTANLERSEKIELLIVHARKMSREMTEDMIHECVDASSGAGNMFCGFPQIVSEFCKSDELYKLKSEYFKKPDAAFIDFLKNMYLPGEQKNVNDKFLALLLVWSKEDKTLKQTELELSTVSDHVKRVLEAFGRSSEDSELLERLLVSLRSHDGGYLMYNKHNGDFEFTHSTICDMVGLTFGKKRKDIALEVCPRDFFMQYIVIADTKEETSNKFVINVEEFRFQSLAAKCCNMLLTPSNVTGERMEIEQDDLNELQKKRKHQSQIHNFIDFEVIKHRAFNSREFVGTFIKHVKSKNLVERIFEPFVLSMSDRFLQYNISVKHFDMRLLDYALFQGLCEFTEGVLSSGFVEHLNIDIEKSLLLAIHSGQIRLVNRILDLDLGARVTGDAIHVAICRRSNEFLDALLNRPEADVNDCGNSINGNVPLIIAASKGNYDAVKRLLKLGAKPCVRNTKNASALHGAVRFSDQNSEERCQIIDVLIEKNVPIDMKGGINNCTPLHLAADSGDINVVKTLIKHGASLNVTDKNGYYPIHTAVVKCRTEVIKILLEKDPSQENLRVTLSENAFKPTNQRPKNMSILHVAIMENKMVEELINMDINPNVTDGFGRTPLIYAIDTKRIESAWRLIKYNRVDTSLSDKSGRTALHAVLEIASEHFDLFSELTSCSNVNAKNKDGETPLHIACNRLNIYVIDHLLSCKSDYRMKTNKGESVFDILSRKRETEQFADVVMVFKSRLDCNIVSEGFKGLDIPDCT